jgi:hypothetical protein
VTRPFGPLLAAVSLLGAGLRVGGLGAQAPSIDEGWSLGAVMGDLAHTVGVVSQDTHPPLYFLLQWLQVHAFGTGLAADRAIAALVGTLLVVGTALFARRATSDGAALFAALLIALSPLAVFYSRDARPHILSAALVLAAGAALLASYRRPTLPRLVLNGLAAGAAMLTAYPAVVILAGQAAGLALVTRRWHPRAVVPLLVAALVCAPWFLLARPNAGQARSILFAPAGDLVPRVAEFLRVTVYATTGGFSLEDVLVPALALLVVALLAAGVVAGRGFGRPSAAAGILGGTIIATLGFYALTSALGGLFVARYLLPITAPLAIGYSAAVWRLPGWWRALAAACLLVGWAWTVPDVLVRDKAHRDARPVAALLADAGAEDRVVFDWFSTRGQIAALRPDLADQTAEGGYDLRADLQRAAASGGRLWLVTDNAIGDREALFREIGWDLREEAGPRTVIRFRPDG